MHLIWSICLGWVRLVDGAFDLVTLTLCFRRKFWYKRAFLKTLGTLIVISILGSIITVQIVEWIGEEGMMGLHDWLEENFQWMTLNKLLAFGGAFFSAFTMFNWWLGYKLFTRSQVIKPKFRLL